MSEDKTMKARRLIAEDRIEQDADHPAIWWVQGGDPDRPYRVQVSLDDEGGVDFLTCTCAWGLHRGVAEGESCYHIEAVRIVLSSEADRLIAVQKAELGDRS
jgi:hypothetical protein